MHDHDDDHRLASALAEAAGRALLELRDRHHLSGFNPWILRDEGDQLAHDLLVEELARQRPDDIVLSEEGAEDRRRLEADRTWIIDPLDGTHDFPFRDSFEWAVHVALVGAGRAVAAAVAIPGLDDLFATDDATMGSRRNDDRGIGPSPAAGRIYKFYGLTKPSS